MPKMEHTSDEISEKPIVYPKIIRSIKKIVSSISVEPTVFLTMFSSIMYQLGVQNLYLEKACRVEFAFNESVCDAMTSRNSSGYTTFQEKEVQKLVTEMMTLRAFIQGGFPVIVVIFAGSWSDRHNRRKPLILFPIVGEILCCALLIVNSILFYELPLILTTLGDSIPFALLGGWPCLNSGIYSYIGSKYKDKEKTMRVGLVTAVSLSGLLLGSSANGILYQRLGFTAFFSLCIFLFSIALLNGYFRVNDKIEKIDKEEQHDTFKNIFSVRHIIDTFNITFKSGPQKRRYKMIALLLSIVLIQGPYSGEISLYYLYTRLKFAWDSAQFAVFVSFQLIVQVFGAVVSVVLFSRIFHWEDTFLGIVSLVGSISSNIIFALATKEIYIFIASCCDLFLMSATISLRSLMAKIVPLQELGQANAMLGLAETMIPLTFGPIYTTVYKYTLDVFPGTFLFVSVIMRSLSLCIFIWLYREALYDRKRSRREGRTKAEKSIPESFQLVDS